MLSHPVAIRRLVIRIIFFFRSVNNVTINLRQHLRRDPLAELAHRAGTEGRIILELL